MASGAKPAATATAGPHDEPMVVVWPDWVSKTSEPPRTYGEDVRPPSADQPSVASLGPPYSLAKACQYCMSRIGEPDNGLWV